MHTVASAPGNCKQYREREVSFIEGQTISSVYQENIYREGKDI